MGICVLRGLFVGSSQQSLPLCSLQTSLVVNTAQLGLDTSSHSQRRCGASPPFFFIGVLADSKLKGKSVIFELRQLKQDWKSVQRCSTESWKFKKNANYAKLPDRSDRPDRPDWPDKYSHPIEYERGGARTVKQSKLPISSFDQSVRYDHQCKRCWRIWK